MQVAQARVSTLERGDLQRVELATVRKYVEALGGRIEVIADFGDDAWCSAISEFPGYGTSRDGRGGGAPIMRGWMFWVVD